MGIHAPECAAFSDRECGPCTCQQPQPHALTREQVQDLLIVGDVPYSNAHQLVRSHDAAQRLTIEQQAQEIERLQRSYDADMKHWTAQLAAMKAERDEWKRKAELVTNDPDYQQCCQVREQAQARVRELEERLYRYSHWTPEHTIEEWLADRQRIVEAKQAEADAQLQAALAAMKAERDEIASRWKHEFELRCKVEEELESHAWSISPAMAQAKIDELNAKLTASEQEAGRLRDILDAILAADERGQGLPFQEAMQEAQRALKGA